LRAFALIWWFAHFNHGLMYMQQALPCTALTKKCLLEHAIIGTYLIVYEVEYVA